MAGTISLTWSSDKKIAFLSLGTDEERAISITPTRLKSFVEAIGEIARSDAEGVVIRAPSSDSFCVGADISLIGSVTDPEIGRQLAAEGQAAFNLLEDLRMTTVAAISGACVGGGCELVLACRYRIITDHPASSIGLPETKLGILPGFGGTVRLPKLVGVPKALDIILAGKSLRPAQAIKAGLVDEVTSVATLLARAEEIARGVRQPKRRKKSAQDSFFTQTALGRLIVRRKVGATLSKEGARFYPAPKRALNVILSGFTKRREVALKREAEELGLLIVSPESKALVHIFHLTEASKSLGKEFKRQVTDSPALVVGAGIMGAGIAGIMARNEHPVIVKDTSEDALQRGKDHVTKELSTLRYLSSFERAAIASKIDWLTTKSSTEERTKFVIEAVFEDMKLKKKILSDLATRVGPDCVLASNTSSLPVSEIAEGIALPERVIGMHFFNPVEKMPLVEIIRGTHTSDHCVALISALSLQLGKFPIVVRDVPGFLVNRILIPYLNEAMFLLGEGYSEEAIDRAAIDFGMPMGPIRLLDEVGLDVAFHVSKIMTAGYGERMTPPAYAEKLLAANRKGRKSGAGFYNYKGKEWSPWNDLKSCLSLPPSPSKALSSTELADRLILHLVNEALKCLAEGVAGDDHDAAKKQIDLGTVMGIGFPAFRGGVIYYAEKHGLDQARQKLSTLYGQFGLRYQPF